MWLYHVEMKFEFETAVVFIESDDLDQRQTDVDHDRLFVVDDRSNVSVVVVRVEQR